jgi:hypothetical protein
MGEQQFEILLGACSHVPAGEVAALIADALHPTPDDPNVVYVVVEARQGAAPPVAERDGHRLNEADWAVFNEVCSDLPPLTLPIPKSAFGRYQLAFLDSPLEWRPGAVLETPSYLKAEVARDHHQTELEAAIANGALRSLDPISNIPSRKYHSRARIPIADFTSYVGKFNVKVRLLRANERAKLNSAEARTFNGRLTLREAAEKIAQATPGMNVEALIKRLEKAAFSGALPMYAPDSRARYTYGPEAHSTVRDFYEEVHTDDLNKWLASNEERTTFRFPTPPVAMFWWRDQMEAELWFGLQKVTPREAALLLCQQNPLEDGASEHNSSDETDPSDYKRLFRVFSDLAEVDAAPRSLKDWIEVADEKDLKYHSWVRDWLNGEHAESHDSGEGGTQARGVTKAEILAAKWPTELDLEDALSDVRQWLKPARVMRGKRGGPSATWNPAMFAYCLLRKERPAVKTLTRVIETSFSQWSDQWVRILEEWE